MIFCLQFSSSRNQKTFSLSGVLVEYAVKASKTAFLVLTLKKRIAKLFLSRFFIYNFPSYLHYNLVLRSFDLYRHFFVIFIYTATLNYISVFIYIIFTAILIFTANSINITNLIYTAILTFFSFWFKPPFWYRYLIYTIILNFSAILKWFSLLSRHVGGTEASKTSRPCRSNCKCFKAGTRSVTYKVTHHPIINFYRMKFFHRDSYLFKLLELIWVRRIWTTLSSQSPPKNLPSDWARKTINQFNF